MNFQEAIDYLYGRLPMFQDVGNRAYSPGLESTFALCRALGNPQNQFKSIHIGGTNGKGSTSHMLASVLQASGYRVGLYTSPHLKSFAERIRVGGQPISEDCVVQFVELHKELIERVNPTFFEMTVAMAFWYFADQNVDIAVIEVGLGGRLDSTNVIKPEVSLITNISFDHQAQLGNTLSLIATEKAGIIKQGVPFVLSETPDDPDVLELFKTKAEEMGTSITIGDQEYYSESNSVPNGGKAEFLVNRTSQKLTELNLDLHGLYQLCNVKGVMCVVDIVNSQGRFAISDTAIQKGLASVVKNTGLKGRWQVLNAAPFVVADTAHNVAGINLTIKQFMLRPATNYRFILGFAADKDVNEIFALLPDTGIYYFCEPSVKRAMPVQSLATLAEGNGISGQVFTNVNKALLQASSDSLDTDAIYIGGSTFVVADLNEL